MGLHVQRADEPRHTVTAVHFLGDQRGNVSITVDVGDRTEIGLVGRHDLIVEPIAERLEVGCRKAIDRIVLVLQPHALRADRPDNGIDHLEVVTGAVIVGHVERYDVSHLKPRRDGRRLARRPRDARPSLETLDCP